jgi:hypothetical protein
MSGVSQSQTCHSKLKDSLQTGGRPKRGSNRPCQCAPLVEEGQLPAEQRVAAAEKHLHVGTSGGRSATTGVGHEPLLAPGAPGVERFPASKERSFFALRCLPFAALQLRCGCALAPPHPHNQVPKLVALPMVACHRHAPGRPILFPYGKHTCKQNKTSTACDTRAWRTHAHVRWQSRACMWPLVQRERCRSTLRSSSGASPTCQSRVGMSACASALLPSLAGPHHWKHSVRPHLGAPGIPPHNPAPGSRTLTL